MRYNKDVQNMILNKWLDTQRSDRFGSDILI